MVWPGINYNTITWFGTKCDIMFWSRLPFVTLSVRYGTKCNHILTWHHCNNIAVTTTNAYTSAKCNTVVHDNTCCTKCNNNDCSYPGNGAECGTIIVTVLLFNLILVTAPNVIPVCLSILFVFTLCLKDPLIENDTVHPELLTLRVICWMRISNPSGKTWLWS